ncbi:putative ribonuclease H-like domain-containing protein [Tanacetum coccineum]
MPDLDVTAEVQSTGIFGNAYDDDDLDTYNYPFADQVIGAEANFNNMEPSTVEPKKIAQALDDESWVEAMQEELLQFKIQKVWALVDLPYGKKAIGIKWVYRNKIDERGIVVKNKPRLVAQGHKQKEGIDYEEVFAPVARVEAIRLFLAFASFMNFLVYQMDVKSAFLYDTIEKETLSTYLLDNGFHKGQIDKTFFIKRVKGDILLVQMSSIGDLTFFLGLQVKQKQDGIFISQDKYVGEILKKFGFSNITTASTLMETNKALTKDEDVCACSRFQVQPKVSHLNAVKRIFRYLKDVCKKQIVVANSTTKAEYIDASHCCGQVLWIQNQLLDYGYNFMQTKIHVDNESTICVVKNPVYHFETKHIEIRHHFIRDSYEKRLIEMVKIHTYHNVADFLTKAFDVCRLEMLFGVNLGVKHGNKFVSAVRLTLCCLSKVSAASGSTEASVGSSLLFNDVDGTACLTNEAIFQNLALMGKGQKFSGRITPLFPSMMAQQAVAKGEGLGNSPESQPTPSPAQTIIEQQIPVIESSSPQNTQSPRQDLHEHTELPQTSVPFLKVADEAVHREWVTEW